MTSSSPREAGAAAGDPVAAAVERGLQHLVARQAEDGSWPGDYSGPLFLLPMYVAACHVTGERIPAARRRGMETHLRRVVHEDGSVGLHPEGDGTMFATSLTYVALRILGVSADDPTARRMRRWMQAHGTPLGAAGWGKLVLAVLNLYPYDGLVPILPELWLLPRAVQVHPGHLWCHCRQVYLPMAWLYGTRARLPEDAFVRALREELYDAPWETIAFARHRETIAASDEITPFTPVLRAANAGLGAFERRHRPAWRERALASLVEHIDYEDRTTDYVNLGPVNSVLNTLVHHFREPGGEAYRRSFAALDAYLAERGDECRMWGYNSSALWDTVFAVQTMIAAGGAAAGATEARRDTLRRAHGFLAENQIREDVPDRRRWFRHASAGGWPFSDRRNGWPVTDCTAEGFRCAVALAPLVPDKALSDERLRAAIELILTFQNDDGGWSSYEPRRGGRWLEWLNPSHVFREIMIDYSYPECSSACLQALVEARNRLPGAFGRRLERAVRRGVRFLRRSQRRDGSWEGSWGVCFTYGTWFGVWGLLAAGLSPSSPEIRRACGFLLAHQNADGGWGESWRSCIERRWVPHAESQVVQSAWALLTLTRAGLSDSSAARRAARFLVARQQPDGAWPEQQLAGVFNKTTLINYDNYRRYFPLWALALHGGTPRHP